MRAEHFLYAETTENILVAARTVHDALGKGSSEKAYENTAVVKLQRFGMTVDR